MPGSRGQKELPPWAMPLAVIVGVLLVVFIAWRALSGPSDSNLGPPKEVHPGMYDFRKEAASGNLGRRTNAAGNNQQ